MLAGKMIRFSDSSVLFVLWVVCVGGGAVFVFQSFVAFQNDSRDRYYASIIYYLQMQG